MKFRAVVTSAVIIAAFAVGSASAQTSVGAQAGVGAHVSGSGQTGAGGIVSSTLGVAGSTAGHTAGVIGSTASGATRAVGSQISGVKRAAGSAIGRLSATTIAKARMTTNQLASLRSREHQELIHASSASRRHLIETRSMAERSRIINRNGLSVAEYNRIAGDARSNPALASRIGLKASASIGAHVQ